MSIADNIRKVQEEIESSCANSGRNPTEICVLAVSKNHPPDKVKEAAEAGIYHFGENRVQEALLKMNQCPRHLKWHMIGHLQSNKARDAVHYFGMIESVDSLAIAQEVNKWAEKSGKTLPILLEVNIAGEATKFGFRPEEAKQHLLEINGLKKLEIHGFMTIAPWSEDAERVRPIFRQLRELQKECEQILGAPLPQLSMGMSGDYQVAVEEGATLLRIGTAIFGRRTSPKKN